MQTEATLKTVTAPVQFSVDTGTTPVTLVSAPGTPQNLPDDEYETHDVGIIDARPMAKEMGQPFRVEEVRAQIDAMLEEA